MEKRNDDMLEGGIVSTILFFFLPIMLGSIFQQLYNTADAIIVGNFVGKQALAAVGGSTGTVINLLTGFVIGLSSGATVVIAQYYGNHERTGVQKGVHASMFLAISLGLILMIIGIAFTRNILILLNVPEEILPLSITYMRLYLTGMIPTLIYNNGAGILRAVGDSKRPLVFLIVACLTNIVLDLLFVSIFHWGVAGAAIATVISQIISAVLTLYVLEKTNDDYHFNFHEMKVDLAILKQIIVIGFPVGIQSCLYCVANLFVQATINEYGTDIVAAYTAFGKIDALFWNTSAALGTACMTFCGQNFGAGNIERVKKGIHAGILMYVIGALAISLFCYVGGDFLFHLFTSDDAVIMAGVEVLRYMCPLWVTFVFVEILSSSIRACGDSLVPMIITACGIGALRILWILFMPASSIYDTLLVYPVSWILTSLIFLGYYLQGGWLKRSLAQREKIMM